MKDIDFLPEWYKERHRRRVHMHHQYAVLTGVVCAMVLYNLVSTHHINAVSAAIDRLDGQRQVAEQVIGEFDATNRQFVERQGKVNRVAQMDSKIDISAALAELSHIISGPVILNRLEFVSEALTPAREQNRNDTVVRPVSSSGGGTPVPLGDVCFRIVMTGVAASPADVGVLACRIEESHYFRQVHPSVPRSGKIEVSVSPGGRPAGAPTGQGKEAFQVSEFEITCYLANYEEVKGG